ncbi:MAG: translocation/assembly module TamB domain-containing protein, partial [candidate division Zixibacteria bacterium]|nr:translocation/assembly module TamB domain-containing protein [candidate division Zixibacteria bacterium]
KDLNARLDLTGFTRIAAVSLSAVEDEEATPEQIELGIHVTGTLEVPEINPVEGSDLARDDIIPLLVANYYSSDLVSASGRLEERITGVIGTQISQIGSRQLNQLGVETFEIDPYYQGQFDPLRARVTVGFYTASKLYVYGRSALSLQSGQEVGFEYRFNRNLLVDGRIDEDQLYRLGLKLHWEF